MLIKNNLFPLTEVLITMWFCACKTCLVFKMHWNRSWILLVISSQGSHIAITTYILQSKTVAEGRKTEIKGWAQLHDFWKPESSITCIIFLALSFIQSPLWEWTISGKICIFVFKYSSHESNINWQADAIYFQYRHISYINGEENILWICSDRV